MNNGPLTGLRVVEFAGVGPGPHCAMLLADLGAEVIRIDRPGGVSAPTPVVGRGRASIRLDLRDAAGRDRALAILERADVLIEGFRAGVMERLGLGPQAVLERNPRLVYGRMTGWGQEGPLAARAGHDLAYIAITGAAAAIGRPGETATPPLNLVGDFGGGSMFLAFGVMSALWERERSGKGQVVDAAIIDGVASLMSTFAGMSHQNAISMERDRNLLGGAAPFYRCYRCADGREMAVSAIEPHFYRVLLERIGAPMEWLEDQLDTAVWPARSAEMAAIFATRDRDEWTEILQDHDACAAPVLELHEAPDHPQNRAREVYVSRDGVVQNAPAPRFSRTPGRIVEPEGAAGLLARWGVEP